MIELRGIMIDTPNKTRRVRLVVRTQKGDQYTTLQYPPDQPLIHGLILAFIADKLQVKPDEIVWPDHVKIPGE